LYEGERVAPEDRRQRLPDLLANSLCFHAHSGFAGALTTLFSWGFWLRLGTVENRPFVFNNILASLPKKKSSYDFHLPETLGGQFD
jgi:hypothetical protein